MTVEVLWQDVFPEFSSESDETFAIKQLTSFWIGQRFAGHLDHDRFQETLLNSPRDGHGALEDLGRRFSDNAELHLLLAEICEETGWYCEAVGHLGAALALRPRWTEVRHRLGRILGFELGEAAAGIVELRAALIGSIRPRRELFVDLARLQLSIGDLRGALESTEIYRRRDPYEPFTTAVLAVCAARAGDTANCRWFANQTVGLLHKAYDLDEASIAEIEAMVAAVMPFRPMRTRLARWSQSA